MIPVGFRVVTAGNGFVDCLAADRETSLGDPDGLAGRRGLGGSKGIIEQALVVPDRVGHGVLEIGIGIHAEKVAGADEGLVGPVDPRRPCVDVAHRCTGHAGARNHLPHLLDVGHQSIRRGSRVGLAVCGRSVRDPVQVLAPDGDAGDKPGEILAVLGNGRIEGMKLVGERGVTGRGPETKKQASPGGDGRRNG